LGIGPLFVTFATDDDLAEIQSAFDPGFFNNVAHSFVTPQFALQLFFISQADARVLS
jgi:hypothetical protein